MNRLAVIVPSKTAANLGPCLQSLRAHEKNCDVVVVDDGVDFDAIRKNPKWDQAVNGSVIVNGVKPFVFARNCNIGIQAAANSDIVLLNDDALLTTPGGLTLLQKTAETHHNYGCIGATTNVTGQIMQKPHRVGFRHVHHIAFMCVLIPRRTIEKIGLLDERYCLDYGVEDRDYCEMINRAGLLVGVHDGCFVDHSKLKSSFRGHPMAPGRSDRNRALFLEKFNLSTYYLRNA
jgi:GT2 family glycosyltransferase